MTSRSNYSDESSPLSDAAKVLWAKSPQIWNGQSVPEGSWLPLYKHMVDSAEAARLLWDNWVSPAVKRCINDDENSARDIFVFLATMHDIGKATPAFQSQDTEDNLAAQVQDTGLTFKRMIDPRAVHHSTASYLCLEAYLEQHEQTLSPDLACALAIVVGGHHGKGPEAAQLSAAKNSPHDTGFEDEEWVSVQAELLNYAIEISGINFSQLSISELGSTVQVILTSLVIITDWIASDETLFPYQSLLEPREKSSRQLASDAWQKLQFLPHWSGEEIWEGAGPADFFSTRFKLPQGATPHPMQEEVIKLASSLQDPGIVIIEAPMGEGKTEAALLAAEIFAHNTGRSGIFFALPTQATTDGIFPRVQKWIRKLDKDSQHSVFLAHGKAKFNEDYRGLERVSYQQSDYETKKVRKRIGAEDDSIAVHEWMQGRKKGILADFALGTVDQVLFAALRQKHLALRHLGLADKVVIIDEVHAYDAYMSQYLERAIQWLGAYQVPVILLSATLPPARREALAQAYLCPQKAATKSWADGYRPASPELKNSDGEALTHVPDMAYPLITYTNMGEVQSLQIASSGRCSQVEVILLDDDLQDLVSLLTEKLTKGGCACVIRNTVKRAQETAQAFCAAFGSDVVELFHSQFISSDRVEKEQQLREKLGPKGKRPKRLIVIGTQVLEQSLDVDFDVMVTDLAPIDLLLQRMGRLHRHNRVNRPERVNTPTCYIAAAKQSKTIPQFEKGAEAIYGRYLLMATLVCIQNTQALSIPRDIPHLVHDVYEAPDTKIPLEWQNDFAQARLKHEELVRKQEEKAKVFRVRDVYQNEIITDWLSTPTGNSEAHAQATVRDSGDSLEVIVVQKMPNGKFSLLPWVAQQLEGVDRIIPTDYVPNSRIAEILAGCTVRLPAILCAPWMIDYVIEELEEKAARDIDLWQQSYWLKGALVLILDENHEAELHGYHIKYSRQDGLYASKLEVENA